MNFFGKAHKQFFFKLLLGVYLVANFSVSIMEGVHFLMHMNDEVALHSFQAHTTTHSHKTLDLIDNLLSPTNPSESPNTNESNLKIKKNSQFLAVDSNLTDYFTSFNSRRFYTKITYHKSPFLTISCPPPDIQSS